MKAKVCFALKFTLKKPLKLCDLPPSFVTLKTPKH